MNLPDILTNFLARPHCKKLIVFNRVELSMGALDANIGAVTFKLGNFKVDTQKVQEASVAAAAMDDYNYMACMFACELEKSSPLRQQLIKWRIGALGLFTNLRMTLIAFEADPSKELSMELESVAKDIRAFNRAIAKTVAPHPKAPPKPPVKLGGPQVSVGTEGRARPLLLKARVKTAAELTSGNKALLCAFKRAGLNKSDVDKIVAEV